MLQLAYTDTAPKSEPPTTARRIRRRNDRVVSPPSHHTASQVGDESKRITRAMAWDAYVPVGWISTTKAVLVVLTRGQSYLRLFPVAKDRGCYRYAPPLQGPGTSTTTCKLRMLSIPDIGTQVAMAT